MSLQTLCCPTGGNCVPTPLPENTLVVNNGDSCGSYSTLSAAIGALTADGQTILVMSDTTESNLGVVNIPFDVTIIGTQGKVVSMDTGTLFQLNTAGLVVKLYQMTFESDGANDVFLLLNGELHVLDESTLSIPNPLAGSYAVRMAGLNTELYVYGGSTLFNPGNSNVNLDDAAVISFQNSFFEALDRNVEGSETASINIDIQDCKFKVDTAGGRDNLRFNQIPVATSRIVRNTFDNGPTLNALSANIWANAKISQNTFFNNGGGAINPLITVAAGATNDII